MDYLAILLSSIAAGGSAFLGAYLRKKGENLATREDLDKLVHQMAAVTETTKRIEANISQEAWDRQRRWEMKRDALFAVARELHAMESAASKIYSTYYAAARDATAKDATIQTYATIRKSDATDTWKAASDRFNAAQLQADLVCQEGVRHALRKASLLIKRQASELIQDDLAGYISSLPELAAASSKVRQEIRRELGIDESLTTAASSQK